MTIDWDRRLSTRSAVQTALVVDSVPWDRWRRTSSVTAGANRILEGRGQLRVTSDAVRLHLVALEAEGKAERRQTGSLIHWRPVRT